jgi:hypothetical protein
MREVGLVLASGLVVWGASGMACRMRLGRRVDGLLAAATLATLQVVATVLFAGLVLGRLSPWVLLGCTVVVSGPLVWANRAEVGIARWRTVLPDVSVGPLWRLARDHPWASILAVGALGQLLWRALISYALPPYGWDALWYHLTTVATWVTTGRITFVPFNLVSNAYPANGEVLTTWVAAFTHSSVGLTGMQLPFGVLGALAVMSLARTVGVSRSGAVAAGSLFFLTPIVLAQTTSNYVDLTGAALVLVALAFGLRFVAVGANESAWRWRLALLCGIAGGLAIGTKTTSIAYVGLIGVALTVVVLRSQETLRRRLRLLGLLAGPVVILGGFWFVRLWVRDANPVYPFALNVGSVRLFAGPAAVSQFITTPPRQVGGSPLTQPWRSWAYDLAPWKLFDRWTYAYDSPVGGFGAVWLLLDVPACVALTWIAARRRDAVFLLLVLIPVVAFIVEPYRWWTRFSIALLAPGVIALAKAVEQIRGQALRRLIASVVVVLVAGSALLSMWRVETRTGATLSAHQVLRLAVRGPSARTAGRTFMPQVRWVDNVAPGTIVAVEERPLLTTYLFPIFGSSFDLHLVPVLATTEAELLHTLAASHAQILAPLPGGELEQIAEKDPRHFQPLAVPRVPGQRRIYAAAYRIHM